ncbi:hypothetical protein M3Y94_00066400 [Aphelenchoides besseyi]|nr:hypothetical protein M3Y94_00066400 [Aphelenchoides besseyi]
MSGNQNAAKNKKTKFDPNDFRNRFRPNTRAKTSTVDVTVTPPRQLTPTPSLIPNTTPPSSSSGSSGPKQLRKKATGTIEEEDKTQFERPVGIKSQPAVTGKHKEQQTGDEKLKMMFKDSKKKRSKLNDDEKTEFVRCRAAQRPAISKGKRNVGLRWKKSTDDPKDETQPESEGGSLMQQLSESSDLSQMSVIDRKEAERRIKSKPKRQDTSREDTCEETQADDLVVKTQKQVEKKKKTIPMVPVLVAVKHIPPSTVIPEPKTPPYALEQKSTETLKEAKKRRTGNEGAINSAGCNANEIVE